MYFIDELSTSSSFLHFSFSTSVYRGSLDDAIFKTELNQITVAALNIRVRVYKCEISSMSLVSSAMMISLLAFAMFTYCYQLAKAMKSYFGWPQRWVVLSFLNIGKYFLNIGNTFFCRCNSMIDLHLNVELLTDKKW